MRHGKRFHADIAGFKGGAGAEQAKIEGPLLHRVFELDLHRLLGEPVAIDWNAQFATKNAEAAGVVGMFVRQKDARKRFRGAANLREAFPDLLAAEPGINQQTGVPILQIGAIAVGTAAENRKLH